MSGCRHRNRCRSTLCADRLFKPRPPLCFRHVVRGSFLITEEWCGEEDEIITGQEVKTATRSVETPWPKLSNKEKRARTPTSVTLRLFWFFISLNNLIWQLHSKQKQGFHGHPQCFCLCYSGKPCFRGSVMENRCLNVYNKKQRSK